MRLKLLTGRRFGRLLLLERLGRSYRRLCDCGQETIATRGNITQGITKSCGCYRRESASKWQIEKRIASGRNPILDTKFNYYKRNAKVRGFSWELTRGDFEQILSVPCEYCGSNENVGIDRVDNSEGYDYSNVLACCTQCNTAKNTQTLDKFKVWVEQTYNHLIRRSQQ